MKKFVYCKFRKNQILIILALSIIFASLNQNLIAQENDSFKEKIEQIIQQLTLDEKISMLHGNSKFTTTGVDRLGIPEWNMSDGPHGVREEVNRHNWEPAGWTSDSSTYLPVGTALSATWNKDLAYEFGVVLGNEARARNKDIILGPGVNIHRTPLCGRNFEYLSEDPYLTSTMAVPYIKGVQEQDVSACLKHYALNNQEYERGIVNTIVDERTLREIYLPAYEAAVKDGKVLTVMSAYNKVHGKWCSENPRLLTDILKEEWGFEGAVMSDWDGTHSTIDAALAGLDIEMGTKEDDYDDYYFADALIDAVEDGIISVNVIDDKVRRILTAMFRTKVFDPDRSKGEFATENHFAFSRTVAEEAVVLLKNENDILPLKMEKLKSIAVIGENAIVKHAAGGGSSGIKTKYEISPLEGLKKKLNNKIKLSFAKGYKTTTTFDWNDGVVDTSYIDATYKVDLRNEAVGIAKTADLVIMFIGLNHHQDTEGADREDMILPYEQDKLIKQVLDVNKNTIIVSIGGSPIDMSEWINDAQAIVQGWYSGSEAGNVFADVLLGEINPSGKLPFTFPKKLEDSPAHKIGDYPGENSTVEYKEGIFVGYRYFDSFNVEPQFAFGHGLSYTDFGYSSIILSNTRMNQGDEIVVKVSVENVGISEGKEVVQLYIEDMASSVKRPIKELKEFTKVDLNIGESKEVIFNINEKMLSFYDVEQKKWKAEPGKFKVHVGSSSDDIRVSAEFELIDADNKK